MKKKQRVMARVLADELAELVIGGGCGTSGTEKTDSFTGSDITSTSSDGDNCNGGGGLEPDQGS